MLLGFLMVLLLRDDGLASFHHNYLTALLASMISCFLYESLIGNSYKKLFIASLLVGMSIFARIPNFTFLGVIGVLLLIDLWYKKSRGHFWKQVGIAISGVLGGVFIVIVIMLSLGHFDIFVQCIQNNLVIAASSSTSTHSFSHLLYIYAANYYRVGRVMLIYGLSLFIAYKFVLKTPSFWCAGAWLTASVFVLLLLCLGSVWVLYGVSFLIALYTFYFYRNQASIIYILAIAFCFSVFMPLGSDFGIGNMGYSSVWLLIPLICFLYRNIVISLTGKEISSFFKLAGILFVCGYFALQLWTVSNHCYSDKGCRFEKMYYIKNSDLATTLTTREKAAAIDTLLVHCRDYIKEGDYVLCFQSLPTMHYLTRTKPYLYNPWVWAYDVDNMKRQLERAEKEISTLPVVIREKGNLPGTDWLEVSPGWNRTDLPDTYIYKHGKIILINQFLDRHGYRLIWQNKLFQIWIPGSLCSKI